MGTYTELKLDLILCKKKTPEKVVCFLKNIVGELIDPDYYLESIGEIAPPFEHDFFKCSRWWLALVSTQFGTTPGSSFTELKYSYRLKIHTCFKNYNGESNKLVDWLGPYLVGRKKKEYVGCYELDVFETVRKNIYVCREENSGVYKSVC